MIPNTKLKLIYTFSFILVYILCYCILTYVLHIKNTGLVIAMSAGFAYIIAPQTTLIKKQSGTCIQLKFWFLPTVFYIQ